MSGQALRGRKRAERRGRTAETLAALWLMAKGYRVLAQRVRTPYGEIDLAAMKAGVLVVVEVKARSSHEAGLYAVGPRQRARLLRAAADLVRRYRLGGAPIRFDVMIMAPGRWPMHVRGAFRADDAAT